MDESRTLRHFSKPEMANFLAAQAVAAATSFIDGRHGPGELAREAERIIAQLELIGADPRCNAIVDPTLMLLKAMIHASDTKGVRALGWASVMAAFVPLLRQESTELARTGAQRQ